MYFSWASKWETLRDRTGFTPRKPSAGQRLQMRRFGSTLINSVKLFQLGKSGDVGILESG
jgi:hypothetical protein